MSYIANLLGYLLNFIYNLVQNYGIAIIIFSILTKLILLPFSIKQQKTMKKTSKIQGESKRIQSLYKNDPQKMNQEIMELYKREKMSPFSGCITSILQIVLVLAMFYLVKSPLTFMKKIDTTTINNYVNEMQEQNIEINKAYPEITIIKEKGNNPDININMNLFGIDLSSVPSGDLKDYKVYIIPVLYILSSIVSMKLTTNMTKNQNKETGKEDEIDMTQQMNKTMTWMIPIAAVSIAFVAPLGLALYWLMSNITMIVERLLINKFIKDKEDVVNE